MHLLFRFQRHLLLLMAFSNVLAALAALLFPALFLQQFFANPPDPAFTFPYVPMYHQLFWGFVFIMGIGYFMAALNPAANRGVLLVGGLGKLLAAVFWIMSYLQGQGAWLMIGGAVWDGLLGIVLLLLLSRKALITADTAS